MSAGFSVSPGRVSLVGAGPGDPALLTLAAVDRLRAADAVFHDALVDPAILAFTKPNAERIPVGKRRGGASVDQRAIEARLIAAARAGRRVVRLKGGDPFVFGRGGEEWLALREAGIPVEVIPGISAGIAGPAAALIPLTHRGLAGGAAFVTLHDLGESPARAARLRALARGAETLVVFMAGDRLTTLARALRRAGLRPTRPIAVIESATTPAQRIHRTTIAGLPDAPASNGGPVLAVIGPTVALAARAEAPFPFDFEPLNATPARPASRSLS